MYKALAALMLVVLMVAVSCSEAGRDATSELCWSIGHDYGFNLWEYQHSEDFESRAERAERYESDGITDETLQGCADYFKRSFREGVEAGVQDRAR